MLHSSTIYILLNSLLASQYERVDVLADHRARNNTNKPPDVQHLDANGHPCGISASTENGDKDEGSNADEDEDEDDSSRKCAIRHSKCNGVAKPTTARYYDSTAWKTVIIQAKLAFRRYIMLQYLFPLIDSHLEEAEVILSTIIANLKQKVQFSPGELSRLLVQSQQCLYHYRLYSKPRYESSCTFYPIYSIRSSFTCISGLPRGCRFSGQNERLLLINLPLVLWQWPWLECRRRIPRPAWLWGEYFPKRQSAHWESSRVSLWTSRCIVGKYLFFLYPQTILKPSRGKEEITHILGLALYMSTSSMDQVVDHRRSLRYFLRNFKNLSRSTQLQ